MGKLAQKVLEERAVRNAARTAFDGKLAGIRQDLDERGIAARIAGEAGNKAKAVVDEALDVANENRGIIAGTIAALAIWIFRNPIIALLDSMLENKLNTEEEDGHDEQ